MIRFPPGAPFRPASGENWPPPKVRDADVPPLQARACGPLLLPVNHGLTVIVRLNCESPSLVTHLSRGCIFSRVRPFYERAVSDLTHRHLCIGLSRSLTGHSKKAHTQLKIWPLGTLAEGEGSVQLTSSLR